MSEVKHIILAGSGGCMRELVWQIQELNKENTVWEIDGYVDAKAPEEGECCIVGKKEIPFLGTDEVLLAAKEPLNVAICTGSPYLRKKIADKLRKNPYLCFPNLILSDTRICEDMKIGEGCVISMDARISTNVKIGDFVFLNTGSKICHDGCLEDFVTLSPGVTLAGNVTVKELTEVGMGTNVIQGVTIGAGTVIGAGSVVIHDIEGRCMAAGVPAEKRKDRK